MFKLMPKIPAVLLVGVIALWWRSSQNAHALESIAANRPQSPPISLSTSAKGTWTLDWGSWEERRGQPLLVAPGWLTNSQSRSAQILIRVEARDSVHPGADQHVDADGWFRVGNATNGATCLILDPARTSSIQYRVVDPDPRSEDLVRLSIMGWNDGDILEAASVGEFFGGVVAVFFELCLGTWLVAQWISRWRRQRADAALASTGA